MLSYFADVETGFSHLLKVTELANKDTGIYTEARETLQAILLTFNHYALCSRLILLFNIPLSLPNYVLLVSNAS